MTRAFGFEVDGWAIEWDDEDDGDCRKVSWFASKDGTTHELDVSPYREPSFDAVRGLVALGFPDRSTFGLIGPIPEEHILAAYWRERALAAESKLERMAA